MWVIAMFDLPVYDRVARRKYTRFRKLLLAEGFSKLQFSVYARYCAGEEIANRYRRLIADAVPDEGQVRVLAFTDVQFGKMEIFEGNLRLPPENVPEQFLLF